jgi:isocitrate/isopropylmalate dehydrogenase
MKYTIALAGDGIGPEVINEAKVSDAIAKKFNHEII